jgi:GAF domain-containing protein
MNANIPLAECRPAPPPAAAGAMPSMDRRMAWLHEPARRLHGMIREIPGFGPLHHTSLSVYDAQYDMLWAFPCHSDQPGMPEITEIEMTDVPSLVLLADSHEPRVVADMTAFSGEGRHHTHWARHSESQSCMTVPISMDGQFLGFVIFGAAIPDFFTPAAQDLLLTFSEAFGILIDRAAHLSD